MIARVSFARKKLAVGAAALILGAVGAAPAHANTYLLPPKGDSVVGQVSFVAATQADTISDIARSYDQGYQEMRHANPKVDPWLPGKGTTVLIPSQYILPDAPREGIVVNVPEMRLYYYPRPAPGEHPMGWVARTGRRRRQSPVSSPSR